MFTKILFLYSVINVGDAGHVKAVYESLNTKLHPLTKYEFHINGNTEELISSFKDVTTKLEDEHYVVFAVGEKGAEALKTLSDAKLIRTDEAYVGLGIHQYFDIISQLPLDYISIPEAVVNSLSESAAGSEAAAGVPDKKNVVDSIPKHTLTFSVPTANPSLDVLKKSYDEWATKDKPDVNKQYIVVMLPGDAPDSLGQMQYFTKDSASLLFNAVESLWKQHPDYTVIVENGPRTGKFDPTSGNIQCSHEYTKGEDAAIAIDPVSKHFVQLLEQHGGIPHSFFNFTFEVDGSAKKAHSVFNQLLYLTQSNSENFFIIPGESVSMLGQIPLYISSHKAIVFKPSSMNSNHEEIFINAFAKNFISYFQEDGSIVNAKENIKRELDDSARVAEGIIAGYNDKFTEDEVNVIIGDMSLTEIIDFQ